MRRRFLGEYHPPKELAELGLSRMSGPGWLEVGEDGVALSGKIIDFKSKVPLRAIALGLAFVGIPLALGTGLIDEIMPIVTIGSVGLFSWAYVKERMGVSGTWTLSWMRIERVVQMPFDDRVFGFVVREPELPLP